jgi:hypothetical protein
MSDSEDDDWRENSDNEGSEDGDNYELNKNKKRINFFQFDELELVYEAAKCNEELCLQILFKLGSVPGVQPFNEVTKLARVVKDELESGAYGMSSGPSFQPFNRNDMLLLNLLYAPRHSRLHSVLKVLCRIENVSHLLPWTSMHHPEVTGYNIL